MLAVTYRPDPAFAAMTADAIQHHAAHVANLSILDAANVIGRLHGLPDVPRPVLVERRATPLSSLWSDCLICGRDVNHCECDPDDYADALLAQRKVIA